MNVPVTSTIEAATRHVKRLLQYSYVNSIATPLLVNAKLTIERSLFNTKSKLFDPNKLKHSKQFRYYSQETTIRKVNFSTIK